MRRTYKFHLTSITGMLVMCLLLSSWSGCEKDPVEPVSNKGTVTDADGNVYQTIRIGNQWWTVEDLRTTHFRNGDAIEQIGTATADGTTWANKTTAAYCNHVSGTAGKYFGLLYNGHAVTDSRGLAPDGWHVATEDDWKKLEKFMSMTPNDIDALNWRGTDQGQKLKVDGKGNGVWYQHEYLWASNSTGFSARPGGCRLFNTREYNSPPGRVYLGFWWSSTKRTGTDELYYRHLDYKKTGVFRYYGPKSYGFIVRCVKD